TVPAPPRGAPTRPPARENARKPIPAIRQPGAQRDTTPTDRAQPGAPADSAAAAPQEPDAVFDALLRLEGYTPVQYRGRDAVFRADSSVLVLRGEAEVERAGQKLTADTIVYQDRSRVARAFGSPKVSGEGQNIAGDVLVYDLDRRVAVVEGGRTQYASGATWYVYGQRVAAEQQTDRIYAQGSTFTSDEREEPQYHFRAGKVMVMRDRLLVGRPAVLYFRNVPVAWLPFIVQDMEKGRRSGILTPRFGINDVVRNSSGYQRQISNVGYYWAINPYLGAQVSTEWRSNSYTSLTGALDFNWRRRFLSGSASWQQYFPDDGAKQRTLSGQGNWRPDERSTVAFSGSYASSSEYVRRRSVDPLEAVQNLNSTFSVDRRFDWGQVNLGARRSQSLGDGRLEWTFPSFGITPNTVTLFRSASPEQASWYNDVTVTLGLTASQTGLRLPGDTLRAVGAFRALEDRRGQAQLNNSVRVGNLTMNNNASLNRNALTGLLPRPLLARVPGIDTASFTDDQGRWTSGISYQQGLIGSTFIAPSLSLRQEFVRDTTSERFGADGFVAGPVRTDFGATLNTDLYGFFPGFAGMERIRHHVKPNLTFTYSPRASTTALQDSVFGVDFREPQNVLRLTLDQTFEAKLRTPSRPQARDTASDTTAAAAPAAPLDARKVTLLAINASALEYDFARASRKKNGFITDQVSGSIRSDFLQGMTVQFGVDLFEDPTRQDSLSRDRFAFGAFSPQISTLSTGFTLGQNSALFRWLGFGRLRPDESMTPEPGMVPTDSLQPPGTRPARTTSTANPQQVGSGPWSMQVNYSYNRPRQTSFGSFGGGVNQMLNGTLAFSPTQNWAVNWATSYNITDAEFGSHQLSLVRDLHRWQANFSFYRTPVGNTSFQFSVHLKDLPDLKVDYNERNIGADRRQ
ncbi:MAG TPA: putative LPS assembly protein LptD, partial [Longimicrobiaceae bacterium]|nr:putative LPS assembly protein LptD [Longimicrobiaceae bacterium]